MIVINSLDQFWDKLHIHEINVMNFTGTAFRKWEKRIAILAYH